MNKKILVLTSQFLLVVSAASASPQQQGQNQTRPNTQSGSQQSPNEVFRRDLYLTGKVVMADGSPIPEFLQVEMVCQGRIIQQKPAGEDGGFSFGLGSGRQSSVMDASVSGDSGSTLGPGMNRRTASIPGTTEFRSAGLGQVDLTGCALQVAASPGFSSNAIVLGRMSVFNTNVGIIYLRRLEGVVGTVVSAKTLQAPKEAARLFEDSRKGLKKKNINYAKVRTGLQRAVDVYPEFAEAWNLLGEVCATEKESEAAHGAFEKAIAADPNFVPPYLALAKMELQQSHWDEAAELSNKLVQLNPYLPNGRYIHAVANFQAGNYDVAEESIRAVQVSPQANQFPLRFYVLGLILANKENFPAAAAEFGRFLELTLPADATTYADDARNLLLDWQEKGLLKKAEAPATSN